MLSIAFLNYWVRCSTKCTCLKGTLFFVKMAFDCLCLIVIRIPTKTVLLYCLIPSSTIYPRYISFFPKHPFPFKHNSPSHPSNPLVFTSSFSFYVIFQLFSFCKQCLLCTCVFDSLINLLYIYAVLRDSLSPPVA